MAWTTSACLRARPTLAELAVARLKPAKYHYVAFRRALLRAQPGVFLALSALTLGALAPLLPTNFIAAILLMTGIALAVFGAGANLAGAVSMSRPPRAEHEFPPISQPVTSAADFAPEPSHHPRPVRIRRAAPVTAASHDWADLMSRVNHELRTPLNAVIGFSEVMALEMFGPLGSERYRDYVRYISDSAADLLKSAEDTLALTALLTNQRPAEPAAACNLDHAIADAWSFVERKATARDVRFALALPEEIEVVSEPRALRQILVNMLSEGVSRAAPGGEISLMAVADGELIEIVLSVGGAPGAVTRAGSLAICLARTLLEMQGTSLLEIETSAGGWRAVTVLDRAVQPDFFSARTPSRAGEREAAFAI